PASLAVSRAYTPGGSSGRSHRKEPEALPEMVNTINSTKAASADLPFAHLGLKPKPAVTRLPGSGTA
ncbi:MULTISPECIES: hypothetical protein, partial [Streptomyces]|uniref:hypothetical protein n=1 Tax=Streptomyces TaxID=1883 RepID=UPI002057B2EF